MALSPDQLSASATAILYCAEDAEDVAAWDDAEDEWIPLSPTHGTILERAVERLVVAEAEHMPRSDYLPRFLSHALDATARYDAVSWILKVNEFYRFSPVTAYLSVNYLDRFLSSTTLPGQGQNGKSSGGWPMQLLSVACVSVAAKMEETHVPLLLDLQVLDPGYVFEPRTVRRMELLLMAALSWRMRAVTPFDFLDLLASATSLPHSISQRRLLFSRATELILSTHLVDFLSHRPSVIAAASLRCAAAEAAEFAALYDGDLLSSFYELVNKEMVSGCCQLMEEYLIDTCPSASRTEPPAPQSPVGVLDAAACGSCNTQRSASATEPDPSRAEPPPSKRRRLGDSVCIASVDTGVDGKGLPPKD